MVMNMNEIVKRLREAIKSKQYSYGELSKLTGIPKSAIQRYATGQTEKIPLDRLEALASALGVSSAYLMGWEEEKPQDDQHAQEEDDAELLEYLEYLRTRPEARILMSTMRGATKEEVEENVRFIEALRKSRRES